MTITFVISLVNTVTKNDIYATHSVFVMRSFILRQHIDIHVFYTTEPLRCVDKYLCCRHSCVEKLNSLGFEVNNFNNLCDKLLPSHTRERSLRPLFDECVLQ